MKRISIAHNLFIASWSSLGVTDILDPDNPGTGEVENRIATLPAGTGGKRFIHLKVVRP